MTRSIDDGGSGRLRRLFLAGAISLMLVLTTWVLMLYFDSTFSGMLAFTFVQFPAMLVSNVVALVDVGSAWAITYTLSFVVAWMIWTGVAYAILARFRDPDQVPDRPRRTAESPTWSLPESYKVWIRPRRLILAVLLSLTLVLSTTLLMFAFDSIFSRVLAFMFLQFPIFMTAAVIGDGPHVWILGLGVAWVIWTGVIYGILWFIGDPRGGSSAELSGVNGAAT